jgi:predicted nuclease with TOPRIM domain
VNQRRQREAEVQKQEAERAAVNAHPAVKGIATANARLAERRTTLAGQIADASKQLDALTKESKKLEEQFKKVKQRVDTVGLNHAIGMLLRKQSTIRGCIGAI